MGDGPIDQPEIRYCRTTEGIRIAYYAMGEGPAIVCASNVLWSHLGYQISFREYHRSRHGQGLGRGRTVVRYDARGTGLSDRSTHDFSLEAQASDLNTVVDQLGLERFALFGRSQATPGAILYAHRHPERVTHLVLLNPFAHGSYNAERSDRFRSQREAGEQNWEEYTLMSASVGTNFADSEQARTLASWFRQAMTPLSFRAFWEQAVLWEVGDLLPDIRVPTLVLYSGAFNYPLAHAREISATIPGARLFVKPALSSYYFWSDDETQAVEEFLGTFPPAGVAMTPKAAAAPPPPSVLTPRETEVLRLLALGRTSSEISGELSLSIRTVGRHITNIYNKAGVRTRAEATTYALRNRIV
ncbi:MAG TPA: alpha/beta fold hydrolase [Dehalococcoidia bacterium]|nr:alpha/beta fold hydrolase [Dehalococcoidia bacterium]